MEKKFTLLMALLLLACITANSQNSTQGTEFWISFMENGYKYNGGSWVENNVMVSAKHACSGTISKPDGSLAPIPFSVGTIPHLSPNWLSWM